MDPIERLRELKMTPSEPWNLEQLALAAHDALSRWRDARSQLGLQFGFPPIGVICEIAPDFELSPELVSLAPDEPPQVRLVILGFLVWATCPATANVPNPFEPMLEFSHHGGIFATAHGYLDIFAPNGKRCSIPMRGHLQQDTQLQ